MGECSKCSWCCKHQVFEVPHLIYNQSDSDYYKFRGIIFIRKNRNVDYKIVPCRCSQLGDDNLCKIWLERPDICDRTRRGTHKIYSPPWCTGE